MGANSLNRMANGEALPLQGTGQPTEISASGCWRCPQLFRATVRWGIQDSGASDVLLDRNWANLMWRLADVRRRLREEFLMGMGRSADEAQQKTRSWLGSV